MYKYKGLNMLDNLFDARRTVRLFLDEPVPNDHVDKIIAAAEKAPSKNCLKPYNIMAFTNTDEGKQIKQHLCRNVCVCEWVINKDDQMYIDFPRDTIDTPQIFMHQELKQIEAPLTLAFVGKWVDDKNKFDNFFTIKDNYDVLTFENLIEGKNMEILTRVIRDCMLSCSWAQLKAQELGYDTAFVGIAGQHDNNLVNKNGIVTLNDSENIIILLCIGKEDMKRWEGSRCQEVLIEKENNQITHVHFYEKRRVGEAEARGNPKSNIIKF
tara:strand:- start:9859 stop:10662 length:804 start_codon:yes stop_codon:yes gene_type:complete